MTIGQIPHLSPVNQRGFLGPSEDYLKDKSCKRLILTPENLKLNRDLKASVSVRVGLSKKAEVTP